MEEVGFEAMRSLLSRPESKMQKDLTDSYCVERTWDCYREPSQKFSVL